jgi:hypothetical protein
VALAFAAPRADAQLTSASLSADLNGGVSASQEGFPLDSKSFLPPLISEDIFLESDTIPWDLFAVSGGGEATSTGEFTYLATNTSQIFTRGEFFMEALAAAPAASSASFDASMSIHFQVAVQTTFTITGFVSTTRALDEPEVVGCQYNGVVLAGDTRATPLDAGTYTFQVERTLFPFESGSLDCAAASSGAIADSNRLIWEVVVSGLPEPGALLASLTAVGALTGLRRWRTRI